MEYLRSVTPYLSSSASTALREVSVAQREIWLAQRLNPGRSFSLGVYAEIDGDVDQNILERAVALTIDETPALRTRFEVVGDQIYKFLHSSIGSCFTVIDLSNVDVQRFQATEWIRKDLDRSRRAEEGDLCAFVLFLLGPSHSF